MDIIEEIIEKYKINKDDAWWLRTIRDENQKLMEEIRKIKNKIRKEVKK